MVSWLLCRRFIVVAVLVASAFVLISSYSRLDTTERNHARSLWQHGPGNSASIGNFSDVDIGLSWENAIAAKRALVKRAPPPVQPARADVYNKAEQKGRTLMCWMENPSLAGALAHSQWDDYKQLAEWGWIGQGGGNIIRDNWGGEKEPVIATLIGKERGKTAGMNHKKDHAPKTVDGVVYNYPATDAQYSNNFYPEHGVIVGDFNYGPNFQIATGATPLRGNWDKAKDRGPELNQLSDIWWILWQKITSDAGLKPNGLKYMVQHNVVNDNSKAIIASVVQKHDPSITNGLAPATPIVITREMDGFAALIGCNNVWGIAWMLIQRQEGLGKKRIKQISAWTEDLSYNFYQPNLLIELEDVPA